ncbi:hypothetical protein ACU5AX_08160 [Sphingomonas sp. XXL09]
MTERSAMTVTRRAACERPATGGFQDEAIARGQCENVPATE